MKLPLKIAIISGILLLFLGEFHGSLMGVGEEFIHGRIELMVKEHSSVHGLTGDYEQDQTIIETVSRQAWTWMRRFHVHAEGMGLKVIVLALLISNLPAISARIEKSLTIMLCIGGFLSPVFWLVLGIFTPILGPKEAFHSFSKFIALPSGVLVLLVHIILLWYVMITVINKKKNNIR